MTRTSEDLVDLSEYRASSDRAGDRAGDWAGDRAVGDRAVGAAGRAVGDRAVGDRGDRAGDRPAAGRAAFARIVAAHRRRLGLTQEELASRAGLSVRGVRDLESGRVRTPRQLTVRLLADVFGLHGAERERFNCLSRGAAPVALPVQGRPGVPPQPGARFMGWLWATDSTWLLVPDEIS